MTPAERIGELAAQLEDEPTAQGILMCLAGMLSCGDEQGVRLLASTAARFSAARMFEMGMSRKDVEGIERNSND